jgi:hypothetical protein
MWPCNIIGQHRRFGLDLLLQSSDGLCRQTQNAPPKHSLPCTYQTIRCPDSDHLINPHHCEHLKSHTKIIQNWNIDGNVTLRKLNYTRALYIFTQYLISHTFSSCVHCFILRLKKLRVQTVFDINIHFTIRATHDEFQSSTKIIPQGNLTSDCEIKQHIWQWKDKEHCSRSTVPYGILTIWMTVTTT